MFSRPRKVRSTVRVGLVTTAVGLALAAGAAGPAMASGNGPLDEPQQLSTADLNSGGANGQCPGGPYCSTRDGSPSLNGNGNGVATGKPAAGEVGKADNKNPQGQMPNGSDLNAGYECDRNHGIGRSNPAHTACVTSVPPTTIAPPKVTPRKVRPAKITPVIVAPVQNILEGVTPPQVLGEVYVGGPVAHQVSTRPLPTAVEAGETSTDGQLVLGSLAAMAGFAAMGTGVMLRRRHGES